MSEINDFKDLKIWQKGIDIAEKCYFLTKLFPKDELYGMVQQIRRSAASIPANIAEGYGRRSTAEYIRFLNIAQGSLNELETHIRDLRVNSIPTRRVSTALNPQPSRVERSRNSVYWYFIFTQVPYFISESRIM
ncbi:four helix bundle protein [Nostoc sp. C110]|uniref:four helix bundle protein n=1 Tax=Nostoc sp. C110 TaxID=3349876 RepID=UPI00370D91D5